jgi:hypothetical protein
MVLRKQPEVLRFLGAARKYCDALESPAHDCNACVERVLRALAALYAAAFGLPDVSLTDDDRVVPDTFDLRHEEWAAWWNRLGELLGNARFHWGYFDVTEPRSSQEQPVIHDLADDLADIYCDVQRGLRAWDANAEAYARHTVWDWRFPFRVHWGVHAASALRALHQLAFFRGFGPSESDGNDA